MYRKWVFFICLAPLVHICYAIEPMSELRSLEGDRAAEQINKNFRNYTSEIKKQVDRIQTLEDSTAEATLAGDNTFTGDNAFQSSVTINGEFINPLIISAYAKFVGTGTVILAGDRVNVSSITDFGTGQYRVNFSTPFADMFFSCNVSHGNTSLAICYEYTNATPNPHYLEIECKDVGGTNQDVHKVNISCLGGLNP